MIPIIQEIISDSLIRFFTNFMLFSDRNLLISGSKEFDIAEIKNDGNSRVDTA